MRFRFLVKQDVRAVRFLLSWKIFVGTIGKCPLPLTVQRPTFETRYRVSKSFNPLFSGLSAVTIDTFGRVRPCDTASRPGSWQLRFRCN